MRRRNEGNPGVDQCFFVPHHGVVKESSSTTKLHPVFNASRKTPNGFSINDFLYVGLNFLTELTDLVTKCHAYQFAFAADIEKIFRQIVLNQRDHQLQAIVWRDVRDERFIYFLWLGYISNKVIGYIS